MLGLWRYGGFFAFDGDDSFGTRGPFIPFCLILAFRFWPFFFFHDTGRFEEKGRGIGEEAAARGLTALSRAVLRGRDLYMMAESGGRFVEVTETDLTGCQWSYPDGDLVVE